MIKLAIAAFLISTSSFGADCNNEFHRFWPFGKSLSRNDISVNIDALLTLRATCENIDSFTSANVKGKIKDKNLKMLEIDLKGKSQQDAAISLNGSIYVMGYELKNIDIERENFIELSETPHFDFDESVTIALPVGPVVLPVDMGYTGELATSIDANLNAWTNELNVSPKVVANLYVASVLDAYVAKAKFGGELLLANEEIEISSNAMLDLGGDTTSLLVNANARHELEALRGNVFISGKLKAKEEKDFHKEIINFKGFTHSKDFYSVDKTIEL